MRTITTLLTALVALAMLAAPLAAAQEQTREEPLEQQPNGNETPEDEPLSYGGSDDPDGCIYCSGPVSDDEPTRTDTNCMDGSADDCEWDYRYLGGPTSGPDQDGAVDSKADGQPETGDGRVHKGESADAKSVPALGVLMSALGILGAALLVARRR